MPPTITPAVPDANYAATIFQDAAAIDPTSAWFHSLSERLTFPQAAAYRLPLVFVSQPAHQQSYLFAYVMLLMGQATEPLR